MYKLYITLENGENKKEKIIQINPENPIGIVYEVIPTMIDEMILELREDEVKLEADRLTQHND